MQGHHWGLILIAVIAGYVAARYFPQVGQVVGLP